MLLILLYAKHVNTDIDCQHNICNVYHKWKDVKYIPMIVLILFFLNVKNAKMDTNWIIKDVLEIYKDV
jgi:hypothetical protein